MAQLSRRSFLAVSAAAAAAASPLFDSAQAAEGIPGFDQTKTDYDRTKPWKPFSDRKVRVGIVGHGVCQFGLAFDLQTHPNVELVAVSDLFPDRCADMAQKAKCRKTYPSLEEMVKDDSQGEYLEAGRVRGEYGGFNRSFVGDAAGNKRYNEALGKGLQIKKCALPPGVQPGGHGGSHGYLGDDFIDAILRSRKPAVDVVAALNMTVPGYYAHLSAQKGGETLRIPQYSL